MGTKELHSAFVPDVSTLHLVAEKGVFPEKENDMFVAWFTVIRVRKRDSGSD